MLSNLFIYDPAAPITNPLCVTVKHKILLAPRTHSTLCSSHKGKRNHSQSYEMLEKKCVAGVLFDSIQVAP